MNPDIVPLYYEECGEGAPLVLLHGNGEDHTVFSEQIRFFAPDFRVIAVDSRGHGKSPKGSGKLSYEAMANDVESLLAYLNTGKCRIIGFSDGAIVALMLAMRAPEKIEQMVLAGANYRPSGLKFGVRVAIFGNYVIYALGGVVNKKWQWKRQLMGLMLCQPQLPESALQAIPTDTLMVVGDKDMIRFRHTQRLLSELPNACLTVIPDCNHFVLQQQPDAFNRLAAKFFEKELIFK